MAQQDPYYQIKRKFHQIFYKTLYPYLESLEDERIKKYKKFIAKRNAEIIPLTLLIIMTPIALILIFKDFGIILSILLEMLYTMFLMSGSTRRYKYKISENKAYENKIKEKIMPKICECFENLTWSQGEKYVDNRKIFYRSALTYNYSKCQFDDVFMGCHKDINFAIMETLLTKRESSSNGGQHTVKIFSGIIIDIEMNKKFKSHTIIQPDFFAHCPPDIDLKHTVFEDVVFEKKYDVYTNDEVEARYLITTAFMERLNNIEKIFKTSGVRASFYKGRLLIGLSTSKDMFCAARLNKSLKDTEEIATMFDEIISIYKLIDYLKLEQKIGL